MGASRTLLRKTKADQTRRQKPENRSLPRGTFNRRLSTVQEATAANRVEWSFHATKGWRHRRVSL